MLSCICLGIGEALILAAFAGTAGLGAHAVNCAAPAKPAVDDPNSSESSAAPCCGHECHAEPAPRRSGMSTAIRGSAIFILALVAALVTATCAIASIGGAEGHDHDHDHGRPFHVVDSDLSGDAHDHG